MFMNLNDSGMFDPDACDSLDPMCGVTGTGVTNTTGTTSTGVVNEVKAGTLDLSFSPSNPAARSVPSQGTVTAASYNLTA